MTAEQLPGFLAGLDATWAGLSLTMPLKQAVLPLLATQSELVEQTQAANTVLLPARRGENTDVGGMVAALREAGIVAVERVVVLGGGATARSAVAAVRELGCARPTVVVRSTPAVAMPADVVPWSPGVLDGCDLVISTLPAGAADRFAEHVAGVPALLDVVYDPWPTPLAVACTGVVVSGASMLLHQAAAQVELITEMPAPLPAMRAALRGTAGLKHLA